MGRPTNLIVAILARVNSEAQGVPESFELTSSLSPREWREQRRNELKNGLTDMQRLFLFGKLSGLNDKDAAIAAGYSLSVAENTKQRIWKPRVRAEFERLLTAR
jgi:hypothetical protein